MPELDHAQRPSPESRRVARGSWRHFVLRWTAASLLVVYVGWNAYWLSQGRLAPSLFKAATGLPCPTTGGTRGFRQLCAGNVVESLRYNTMTVPILLLFALSLVWPAAQLARRRRAALPGWLVLGWAVVLLVAWVLKLCGDPQYW